jgi:plastocyanin
MPGRLRAASRAVAAACVAAVGCAHAATHVVTANSDLTFTPAQITIHQGDVVEFVNAGGVHNVHADNDRFICAINCTTNNAPSDQPWHAFVQFNQIGTFGYYCDAHGDLQGGMRGAVTVIDRVFADGFDGPPSR